MNLLVNIDVDDLSKAIAFYEEAAGLRLSRRFGSIGAEMLGASSAIYLLVKPDGPGRQQVQTRCVAINGIGHQCILISSSRNLRLLSEKRYTLSCVRSALQGEGATRVVTGAFRSVATASVIRRQVAAPS